MEFRLLGPLEVTDRGRLLELSAPKMRSLLAALLLNPNAVVSADRLVEDLWPETTPATAKGTLQTYVSRLRRVLEPGRPTGEERIVSRRPGYLIRVDPNELDVGRFEALVAAGRSALAGGQWKLAAETLRRALALWRGPALAELASEPFAQAEAVRLDETRLRALEDRIAADLALGAHAELVGELEALVGEEPLRETLRGQLMVALYRSGRQVEALRSYEAYRRLLIEQLGVNPSPELRRLEEALLLQSPDIDWAGAPRVTTLAGPRAEPAAVLNADGRPSPIPLQLTSYVAPEHVRKVQKLLAGTRLVTLTGTGGIGKTRLALEVAAVVVDDYEGTAVVELASIADPNLVPQQVLTALGAREAPGQSLKDVLVDHVAARRLLLLLDNCEHVLEASARLAHDVLAACPNLRVLATSRERLRLPGEIVWMVPGLSIPPPEELSWTCELTEYDAVRLFLDRAMAVRGDLEPTMENLTAVAEICRRLDGIPLALELAAARTSLLSVEELAERLDDRFRLLTAGSAAAPERHRTLRAAVEWTYEALSETERRVFERSCLFSGSFDLQAVEHVAAGDGVDDDEVLVALGGLVDKSLVLHEESAGRSRYRLLETLRQYGAEKLTAAGEETAVRSRYQHWALSLAQRTNAALEGSSPESSLERLALDYDNLRVALAWVTSSAGDDHALRLPVALSTFWYLRGLYSEGREWLEAAMASGPQAPADLRAEALHAIARLALAQGDYTAAESLQRESLTLFEECGDLGGTGRALRHLANLAWRQDRYAEAASLAQASLDIARRMDDKAAMAASLGRLSGAARGQGDFQRARRLREEALALHHDLGDDLSVGFSVLSLAQLTLSAGDYRAAEAQCREAEAIGDRHGATMLVNGAIRIRAEVAIMSGDHGPARHLLEDSLARNEKAGDRHDVAWSRQLLADLDRMAGDLRPARSGYDDVLAAAWKLNDRYMAAWSLRGLARVASAGGDQAAALALCRKAVLTADEIGDKPGLAAALEILAGLAARGHRGARAALLLGAAHTLRLEASNPVPRCDRGEYEEILALARKTTVLAAFERGWAEGLGMARTDVVALAVEMTDEGRPDFDAHQRARGSP